jgi:acyl-CoA dehydrogenase
MVATGGADLPRALAGSAPYLKLMGIIVGGALLTQGALAAEMRLKGNAGDGAFHEAKLATTRFFAEHVLATAPGLVPAVKGGATTMSFDLERL